MAVMAGPSRRSVELIFAAALVAVAGGVFVLSAGYPADSAAFPRTLAALLAVCSAIVAMRQIRGWHTESGQSPFFEHLPRFLVAAAAIVLYVFAVGLLGYVLPSLVFGVVLPFLLGFRGLRLTLSVTVGTILFILLVFGVVLERPLPPDVLGPLVEAFR